MKKVFILFAVAGALVACNNSGEGTNGSDTTIKTSDTMSTMNTVTNDTMSKMGSDTMHKMSGDTSTKMTTTTRDTVIHK